jgi:hypothetical protein
MTTDESRAIYLFEQKKPRLVRQKLRARLIFRWYKRKMGNARGGKKGEKQRKQRLFCSIGEPKNT